MKMMNTMALLSTGNPYWSYNNNIDGTKEYKFYVELIYLLDKVILTGDILTVDSEQKEFFMQYFSNNTADTLDELCKQFDEYLAGYLEILDETYERSPIYKGRDNSLHSNVYVV